MVGLVVASALLASACGTARVGGSPHLKPERIYPTPAGLLGATAPTPTGTMWLLAKHREAATIRELDLHTGSMSTPIPVADSARSVAENASGTLGIGLRTKTTGALQLLTSHARTLAATVPLSAPATSVTEAGNVFTCSPATDLPPP